jgi:hypothetical protein
MRLRFRECARDRQIFVERGDYTETKESLPAEVRRIAIVAEIRGGHDGRRGARCIVLLRGIARAEKRAQPGVAVLCGGVGG